jgi:hypothetical protein
MILQANQEVPSEQKQLRPAMEVLFGDRLAEPVEIRFDLRAIAVRGTRETGEIDEDVVLHVRHARLLSRLEGFRVGTHGFPVCSQARLLIADVVVRPGHIGNIPRRLEGGQGLHLHDDRLPQLPFFVELHRFATEALGVLARVLKAGKNESPVKVGSLLFCFDSNDRERQTLSPRAL